MTDSDTSDKARPRSGNVPWLGFRFVFGVINGAIWFVIPFVMVFWLASTLPPERLVRVKPFLLTAPTFFVAVFGLPGCLPAAIEQAKSGIFRMPADPAPGGARRGILGPLWLFAPLLGATYFCACRLFVGPLADASLTPFVIARNAAFVAAFVSFAQASTVSGSAALYDLRPNETKLLGWYEIACRTGAPQGLANAFLVSLLVVAQGSTTTDGVLSFSRDIFVSCLGIGGLALAGGGGILGADLAAGRVKGTKGRVPPRLARLASVAAVATLVTLPCALVAALCGGAGPVVQLVANVFAGGASAFGVATLAGHWALTSAANAESTRR